MIESDMERRMTSIAPECNDAKRSYDDCFNQWFHNTYMRQRESTHVSPIVQSNPCNHLLKVYLSCVIKELKSHPSDNDLKHFANTILLDRHDDDERHQTTSDSTS